MSFDSQGVVRLGIPSVPNAALDFFHERSSKATEVQSPPGLDSVYAASQLKVAAVGIISFKGVSSFPIKRYDFPSTRKTPMSGCFLPVQWRTSSSFNLSVNDHALV